MRRSPMSMILVLACVPIFAQGASPRVASPTAQGCPVNFSARRTGGLIVQYANRSPRPISQGLHLTFTRHAAQLAKIVVTVHGMPAHGGVMPVHSNSSSDIAETFTLENHAGAGIESSEIRLHRMGPARSVELNQIEFADGSVWQKSKDSTCVAVPSPFLLVAAN